MIAGLGSIVRQLTRNGMRSARDAEEVKLLMGRVLSRQNALLEEIDSFEPVEFRVFSQFGDDGIIQYLLAKLDIDCKSFIEFGVENYAEANTRFLLMNDNWSGFVMDGSPANMRRLSQWPDLWKYELRHRAVFIDRDNINDLLAGCGLGREVGLLHVDLDGNDYWVWERIEAVSPQILILEYNCVFGCERAISVPYDAGFQRGAAHHSTLYWGASLPALHRLCEAKGYAFVGCNSAGNNAYFVRRDKMRPPVRERTLKEGFVSSKLRQSRNEQGELTFAGGDQRLELLKGLPVVNVVTQQMESL